MTRIAAQRICAKHVQGASTTVQRCTIVQGCACTTLAEFLSGLLTMCLDKILHINPTKLELLNKTTVYCQFVAERTFRGIFFLSRRIFLRILSPNFSPYFCGRRGPEKCFVGKGAQKNPPGKSPAISSRSHTTKIPDTCLGNKLYGHRMYTP